MTDANKVMSLMRQIPYAEDAEERLFGKINNTYQFFHEFSKEEVERIWQYHCQIERLNFKYWDKESKTWKSNGTMDAPYKYGNDCRCNITIDTNNQIDAQIYDCNCGDAPWEQEDSETIATVEEYLENSSPFIANFKDFDKFETWLKFVHQID